MRKTLKKRYDCKHEKETEYGVRKNWTYFHAPELDQYTDSGRYETPCCNACFEEWTKRVEAEGVATGRP